MPPAGHQPGSLWLCHLRSVACLAVALGCGSPAGPSRLQHFPTHCLSQVLHVATQLRMWGGGFGEGVQEGEGEATYYDRLSKDADIVKVRGRSRGRRSSATWAVGRGAWVAAACLMRAPAAHLKQGRAQRSRVHPLS